ncbi:TonB-dependent receptor [Xanthomonas translucens]|uniref:TonB-dependent receptor n=1 Tax=Xanthomonas campestris pv. translucens TaxID=343 RepID=UPI00083AD5A0|nr:TonB-dependent receptor [Xanthomonas translucens]UJB13633.1 TonB-dependent receptor [Xanthomonas translucens pv. undulosa]WLA10765.1 TonB-dependent receptor [Xanthomonas translucens]
MKHPRRSARPAPKLLSCALASCLLLGAAPALAQSTGGTIRGQVMVDSVPATAAQVTATNLATGLTRSVQVSNGVYAVGGLPPGSYRIDVAANGQTTSQNVTVQVGQVATLNLGVGGEAATATAGDATTLGAVNVTAPALVETRTSENATYISNKLIESLPRATRNFLELADTVPGVQFSRDGQGNTTMRSGATSANGTNVFIDGVSQKNYVLTGGVSGQDSSRGNPFPQSAIGEYKVITSNYKAEFDQLSSAAVVAATRSGGNAFEGSFFWDYTNDKWRKPSPLEERDGKRDEFKEEQYGATFSGPILKDVAHFFVAYEAKEYVTPGVVQAGSIYRNRVEELPANLRSQIGTYPQPFKEDLYFGKLDWTIGENHYFELSGKYRKESSIDGIDGTDAASYATDTYQEDKRADLRYQFTYGRIINDAHVTYENSFVNPQAVNGGLGYNLMYYPADGNPDAILSVGAGSNYQRKGQKGVGLQDDLTLQDLQWHGTHTLKMGVKYKDVELNTLQQIPYNPQFYYNILTSTEVPYQVQFGDAVAGTSGGNAISKNKQYGIYLQDDWEVDEHLTLNLGVRWDYEKTPSFLNFQTPGDVSSALLNWSNLDNADYNIRNYISTGNNRKAFKDAWQPRLGFSYDLAGDQRHVIFGGAGRAYDRNIFDYLSLEQLNGSFRSYTYYFQSAANPCRGQPCLGWDPAYLDPAALQALVAGGGAGSGREIYLIDNDIKTPYSDQFSLGMRNAVDLWGNQWNTEVTLSHIASHDGFAFMLGNRRADGSFFAPGTVYGAPFGEGPDGFGSVLLGTNALETRDDSLGLKIDKPYTAKSGWGVTVAYTFSNAKENRKFGEHYSLDYPSIGGYGWHQAAGVPKHRLVATAIYDLPWDITLSGKLTLSTPTPFYGTNCLAGNDQCSIIEFTPDRSIGYKDLSLTLNKQWDTGSNVKFNVRADVLNVFNWINYNSYGANTGTATDPDTAYGTTDYQIYGQMRTFRLSFGLNW